MAEIRALNLFSGAGGWEVGAARVGIHPLGVEMDCQAIATTRAAGHGVYEGDVAALDPADLGPCDLLIASPPCQAWSTAGNGGGRRDVQSVYALTDALTQGVTWDDDGYEWVDERSRLVTEPLRWALALEPRWIALEQVPPVLEYWRHLADVLRERGYSCWAGILECERFGVPQTRERAILMADREAPVVPPRPTHQRFVPREPQRHEHTLEGEVLPWVSMAEALEMEGDWAYRLARGTGMTDHYGERPDVSVDRPAPVMTSKATWVLRGYQNVGGVAGARAERAEDAPSLTVSTRADLWQWRSGSQANASVREQDQPASTIFFGNDAAQCQWVQEGSPQREAVRVTVEEAAILQGFPAGYPWQGTRTAQFQCVGNAIPPPLALVILDALCP